MSNTLLEDVLGVITPLEEDPWMRPGQMALNPGQQPTQMPNNRVGMFSHIPPEEQLPRLGAQLKSNIQGIPARLAEQNRKSHETFERVRAGGDLGDDIINEAIDWSPMGFGGVIRPTTWAAYTPHAKAAITGTANRHPELFKKVLEHPRDLLTTVETMENMGNKLGSHQRTQFKNPRGEPMNWMKIREDVKGREDVVPHELTHMLQNQRAGQMDPTDAATIGKLMKDILPPDLQGSLRQVEQAYHKYEPVQFGRHYVENTPEVILEGIKQLDEAEKAIAGPDWKLDRYIEPPHVTPGYNAYDDTSRQTHEVFGRMMADESFAHLAEALTGHHSSPQLRKLANELGVFLDNPARGWKESMDERWANVIGDPSGWGSTATPTGKLAEILKNKGTSAESEVWKVIRRMYDQAKGGSKGSGGTGMADVPPGRNPREAKLTPEEQTMWNKLSPEHRRSITPEFQRKPHNPESRRLFNQIMRKIAKENKGGGGTESTGMISPKTWQGYSPEAKASMTDIARQYPEKFKQILEDPLDLRYKVSGTGLPANTAGRFRHGGFDRIPSTVQVRPGYEKGPGKTPIHELSHYLNRERVYGTDPDDAMTIGRLLQSIIPYGQRSSLDSTVMRATDDSPKIIDRLREMGGNFDERPIKKNASDIDSLFALDEAFAHLAQAAAKPGASPELKKLAQELGIDWTK